MIENHRMTAIKVERSAGIIPLISIVLAGLALIVSACVPTVIQKTVNRDVPGSYRESTDTINSATMNWREYYRDPALVSLIDSALARNQELNVVMQEIEIAQNEVLARSGEYLPFVNLRAGGGVDKAGAFTRNGAVEEGLEIKPGERFPKPLPDVALSATVQWEVDIWNRLRNATRSAGLRYMASTEGARFLVTNLVSEIASNYYELIALDNLLEAVNSNISILKNALTIIEQQKLAARTTELAVRRFEAEVLKNESHRYEIQQRITETENRINYLVGRYPQRVERVSTGFFNISLDSLRTGIPSQLLQNRPDVRQSELELTASELDIDVARARFYPSLSIAAGIGYQAFNPQFLFTTPESVIYNLAGELLTPVINRRGIVAALNTSNAKQIQSAYNYERTLLTAYIEVANSLAKVSNLQSSLALKTRQVAALTESVDIAGMLFTSARADYMEVLLTQRDALEAKMELIDTKVARLKASIELYRALGGGWR